MPFRKIFERYEERGRLGQQLRAQLRARRDKSKDPGRRNVYNIFIWSQAANDLNKALTKQYRKGMISKSEVPELALKFVDHLATLESPGGRVTHELKTEKGHTVEMAIEAGRARVKLTPAGKVK